MSRCYDTAHEAGHLVELTSLGSSAQNVNVRACGLCRKYGLRVAVLNDFEAAGYGISVITEKDWEVLNNVPAAPQVCPSVTPSKM